MTSTALATLEHQLEPLLPRLDEVLAGRMAVARLKQTLIISCERAPKLLECDRQSLFNAAMSAAVLGLEVDGVTGQAFLIPYKERAQLVIGYRGYNTMAARSGYTVTGAVVREGDEFAFQLGSAPFLKHMPRRRGSTGRTTTGRITNAWAVATHMQRPPIIVALDIDEILAIKGKSPGARKPDSPWNDEAIGFPAMAEKTAKRRLARSMPLNVMQLAARLEEAFDEQGRPGWIDPARGPVIEGELGEAEPAPQPTAAQILSTAGTPDTRQPDPPASTVTPNVSPPSDAGGRLSIEDEARAEAKNGEESFLAWLRRRKPTTLERERVNRIGGELRNLMNDADLGPEEKRT